MPKKIKVHGPIARQNELLQKACSYLENSANISNEPTIPTIAKAWGEKLLQLEPQQRTLAEKAINDVLFEASMGSLNRHSVKINEEAFSCGTTTALPSPNNYTPSPHHQEDENTSLINYYSTFQ